MKVVCLETILYFLAQCSMHIGEMSLRCVELADCGSQGEIHADR